MESKDCSGQQAANLVLLGKHRCMEPEKLQRARMSWAQYNNGDHSWRKLACTIADTL